MCQRYERGAGYIDLLSDLLLLRRLSPWCANTGKRLVKSPKVLVRDSGLVHALLAIKDHDALLSHPVVGASWEAFMIENLLGIAPEGVQGSFYRTGGGAEIDLLLHFPDGRLWAIEIKRSLSPRRERGFHSGCAPRRRILLYCSHDHHKDAGSLPPRCEGPGAARGDALRTRGARRRIRRLGDERDEPGPRPQR